MGVKTGIEWTDATWNPIIGCSRVSEGCRHCYAEGIAGRFGGGKETVYSDLTQIVNGRAVWTGKIKETKKLMEPLSWRSPKRVFVNSMSDLFHENVTDEQRDRFFAVMVLAWRHTYQILTKRPALMLAYMEGLAKEPGERLSAACENMHIEDETCCAVANIINGWSRWREAPDDGNPLNGKQPRWPLPNVWLGVSVENQAAADERIPLLLQTPAAVRFLSCEPMLGLVDLAGWVKKSKDWKFFPIECKHGYDGCPICDGEPEHPLDWIIAGGESGPGARPMHPDWARGLRDQCAAAGVPFFFKQWGDGIGNLPVSSGHIQAGWTAGIKKGGSKLDDREWKQFPTAKP